MQSLLTNELSIWNNLKCQIWSDFHFSLEQGISTIVSQFKKDKQTEVLFLLWDIFQTVNWEDSSKQINNLIIETAELFEQIIFTPWNHDLRWRDNPWISFDLPENVCYPKTALDINIPRIHGNNILVANLFYDMKLIDPSKLWMSEQDLLDFYATTKDGEYLLWWDTEVFKQMASKCRKELNSEIDILAVHSLPHPSLTTFKEDSIEWNKRSLTMGSDILTWKQDELKNGLVVLHWHNHRKSDNRLMINDKQVHILSWEQDNFWGELI